MTFKSQVTQGLKWQAITIVGRQLLSLVVFTTLARLLEPAAFGLVALVGVYNYFASMLADLGIGMALVQRKNLERQHLDTFFWFNVGFNALLCCATLLLANPVAALLGEPELAPLLRWSSIGLMFGAFSAVQNNLFVRSMDFRRPGIRILIANVSGGLVGVVMAFLGYGVWALVGQSLASGLSGAVFIWFASDYRPKFMFSIRHFRDLFAVGSSVFANAIIWFFSSRLDQLVIGRFAGAPALGLYVIANKIPEMIRSFTQQPLTEVSVPALSSLQHDHMKMRSVLCRGMELNALIVFPIFVGLAAVAPTMVPFLFGSKWAVASDLCSLLSIFALINALQIFSYPALLAAGVTGKYVLLNSGYAVGVAVACLIGVQFGVTYVVIGLIFNNVLFFIPGALMLRHRIGLNIAEYYRPCLWPALAAAIMWAVVWSLPTTFVASFTPVFLLATQVFLGAAVYVGFMLMFNRDSALGLLSTLRHALGVGLTPEPSNTAVP